MDDADLDRIRAERLEQLKAEHAAAAAGPGFVSIRDCYDARDAPFREKLDGREGSAAEQVCEGCVARGWSNTHSSQVGGVGAAGLMPPGPNAERCTLAAASFRAARAGRHHPSWWVRA